MNRYLVICDPNIDVKHVPIFENYGLWMVSFQTSDDDIKYSMNERLTRDINNGVYNLDDVRNQPIYIFKLFDGSDQELYERTVGRRAIAFSSRFSIGADEVYYVRYKLNSFLPGGFIIER